MKLIGALMVLVLLWYSSLSITNYRKKMKLCIELSGFLFCCGIHPCLLQITGKKLKLCWAIMVFVSLWYPSLLITNYRKKVKLCGALMVLVLLWYPSMSFTNYRKKDKTALSSHGFCFVVVSFIVYYKLQKKLTTEITCYIRVPALSTLMLLMANLAN